MSLYNRGAKGRSGRYVFRGGFSDYEYDEDVAPVSVSSYSATAGAIQNILDNANAARVASDDAKAAVVRHIPRAIVVKRRVMIITGRPGSGKGTQGRLLAERSGIMQHFSSGDFFRGE